MRYYCKNCDSVFELGEKIDLPIVSCPFCEDYGFLPEIPDYETLVQYEARTGKPFPADNFEPDKGGNQ